MSLTIAQLEQLAEQAAMAHGIDPALVKAVCHHESGNWKVYAVRYEPAFYARYVDKQQGLSITEKTARAFSYGLMQIMGQTAREYGFTKDYLTELLDPVQNLEFGCRKLARCLDRCNGDVTAALLQYNGGQNKKYPELVLRHLEQYKRWPAAPKGPSL